MLQKYYTLENIYILKNLLESKNKAKQKKSNIFFGNPCLLAEKSVAVSWWSSCELIKLNPFDSPPPTKAIMHTVNCEVFILCHSHYSETQLVIREKLKQVRSKQTILD